MRRDVAANDLGRTPGEFITLSVDQVVPNGGHGTTGSATTLNLSTGLPDTITLTWLDFTIVPNEFNGTVPYNPNLTGQWTETFQNGADTSSINTPGSVTGASPPPFASSVTITGSGETPTISWVYPAGSVDGVFFNIYDQDKAHH